MHIRQAIRDNIATTLTGLTLTGDNVYKTRVYPMIQSLTYGIIIYSEAEDVSYITMRRPRTQERIVSFKIEVYVKTNQNFDDKMDNIMAEIEEALYTDASRGGYAIDTTISDFQSDFNGDGELPIGVGDLSVKVKYHTLENLLTTT